MWADDLVPYGVTLTFGDVGARLALTGVVDVATGSALIDAVTSAVARYTIVEVDLSAVTDVDPVGIRALLKVRRFAEAHGAVVSFVGAASNVIEACRFDGVAGYLGVG